MHMGNYRQVNTENNFSSKSLVYNKSLQEYVLIFPGMQYPIQTAKV